MIVFLKLIVKINIFLNGRFQNALQIFLFIFSNLLFLLLMVVL